MPTRVSAAQRRRDRDLLIDRISTFGYKTPSALSSDELVKLAASKDREVRARIAGNPRIPSALQERLARDRSPLVRRALARVANRALAVHLLGDRDEDVRTQMVRFQPAEALAALAVDAHPAVRARVADHDDVTTPLLHQLAADPDPMVRLFVAHARRTPRGMLRELAGDVNARVRTSAMRALDEGARLCDCCGRDHGAVEVPTLTLSR